MDDKMFLREYEGKIWHTFKEIERYARLSQSEIVEFGQVTDDTEATF